MTQNNSTEQNSSLSQSLYNELEGLKIRIAFAEIDEDELNEFERNPSSVSESDYSDAAQKKALKLIEHKLNKRLRKQFVLKTLPRTLHIVTITLLLFFVGLTTAIATVRPVRLRILDFIARIEENYSEISLVNDIDYAIVPAEWKGKYYPFYIPGAFKLSHVEDFFNLVHYTSADNRILHFGEYMDADYSNINIDKENATNVTINDNTGIAMTDDEGSTITWCINDTYLYLYYSGNFDEAKRIAESVRLIHPSKQ